MAGGAALAGLGVTRRSSAASSNSGNPEESTYTEPPMQSMGILEDAFELAGSAASAFQGTTMVILIAATVCLRLIAIGRRNGAPTGLALATFIALEVGFHNFGEGLAIGAAIAAGATSLGAF